MPIQVIERVKGPLFFDRQVMPPGWMTILFFALDECDFITLYTLATNHGLLSIAALSCLRIRLNIMLKRFVVFPVNLRKHLDLTKSVLSGSFVLELMLYRMGWFCNDLDIYTTKPFVDKWDQFLKLQGYVVVDVSESDIVSDTEDENTATIHSPTIAELRTYEACIRGVIRRIDVVVSETDSALDPICHFWSSCLQNFVTGKRIVISHPVTTLRRKMVITPSRYFDNRLFELKWKYRKRGIDVVAWQPEHMDSCGMVVRQRSFMDQHTLRLDLVWGKQSDPSCLARLHTPGGQTWTDDGIVAL